MKNQTTNVKNEVWRYIGQTNVFFNTQPKNLFRSYQERLKLLLQAKGFYYKAFNSSKNQANLDGLNKKMNLDSSEIYIPKPLDVGEKIKQTLILAGSFLVGIKV